MKNGQRLISAERSRQILQEGFTAEHDARYRERELERAAECYLDAAQALNVGVWMSATPSRWPWKPSAWKPGRDAIANLVKAGALFYAAADRAAAFVDHETAYGCKLAAERCAEKIDNIALQLGGGAPSFESDTCGRTMPEAVGA